MSQQNEYVVQINKERYYHSYDNLLRFISYYYQIMLIQKLHPSKILEIGVGNKVMSGYLKNSGVDIETCDFDAALEPTYVADARKLPIADNTYDLIAAFEILEHVPWDDLDGALQELHRVTRKHVVISIPYASTGFEFVLRFPFIETILHKQFVDIFLRLPLFRTHVFHGQHYWEMGKRGYPIAKIRKALQKHFVIVEEVRPPLNYYHYFFVLEKI